MSQGFSNKGRFTVEAGKVVQVIRNSTGEMQISGTVQTPLDDTIPQISEGYEVVSATITPTDANNWIKIEFQGMISHGTVGQWLAVAAFRDDDTDAIAVDSAYQVTATAAYERTLICWVLAGQTTDLTISIRAGGNSSGVLQVNSNGAGSRMYGGRAMTGVTLTEYASGPVSAIQAQNGKVLQVQHTNNQTADSGTLFSVIDTSIPQNTELNEIMTLAITPTNASSKLLIEAQVVGSVSAVSLPIMALFQDSGADALACSYTRANGVTAPLILTLRWYMTAGTTSETTFKIRAGLDRAGTFYWNQTGAGTGTLGGTATSALTITEIAA